MNYTKLRKLKEKIFFDLESLREILNIKRKSAAVLSSRYTKQGILVRLKRNFYVLNESWENFNRQDFYKIANLLQVPSYISFISALAFYEITTQAPQDYFESAALKRSTKSEIKGTFFNYYKLKKTYYFGFVKKDGIFIATKEKAFVDAVYLYSFGKYKVDFSAIELSKLDKNKLKMILKIFPEKTRLTVKRLCRI